MYAWIADLSRPTQDIRQCLLYDSPAPNARLIGVEYMIIPALFATIADPDERRLWHSHVFEAKSGMLVMPQPATSVTPAALWRQAETAEMAEVTHLYGKAYHLWQADRGDALPLGPPALVTSFTDHAQLAAAGGAVEAAMDSRDARFGTDWRANAEARKGLEEMVVHPGESLRVDTRACFVSIPAGIRPRSPGFALMQKSTDADHVWKVKET